MCIDANLRRTAALALLIAATLVAAGCSSNSATNTAPTVTVAEPQVDLDVQDGAVVQVTYTDNDPDDVATTDVYADLDGDLATAADRYSLVKNLQEQDGTARTITWDTAGIPEGAYFIMVVTSDGTNPAVTTMCPGKVNVWRVWPRDHSNILLKDHLGNAIPLGSTQPYSSRETCGACHNVDEISNGYHFQQGRTDANGNIVMKDNFNNDGRDWLKSAGMYGKW